MAETFTNFEFNYASFSLKPYSGDNGSSSRLLKNIIQKLQEPDFPRDKRIIDRHENRKNTTKRELVIISNTFERAGVRCFGKIALIKNKAPLIWGGKDINIIEEIEKDKNKQFIEITNYVIHFCENSDPVIMYEFNNEGPRLSDIEFYIRQIGKEFAIAKNIQTIIHLKTSYEQLDKDIKNVFGVTVKVNSTYNNKLNWLKVLKTLNDESGYKDVRLELFFNRKKEPNGKYIKNIRGLDFAREIITWLKKNKNNIDYLDDLKMTYQIEEEDNPIDLDFLKNKVFSNIKIPLIDGKIQRSEDFRFAVGQEFNYYLKNGFTTSEQ